MVEETGVPRENHRPVASHWQTLSHNVASSTPLLSCIRTHNVSGNRHAILYSKPVQTLWLVRINIERSRNCLPFASTWIHPGFFGGDHVTHLFMFSVVLYYFLRPAFCVPNVACEYLSSVYSWLYLRFSLCLSTFELVLFFLHDIALYSTTVFQPL